MEKKNEVEFTAEAVNFPEVKNVGTTTIGEQITAEINAEVEAEVDAEATEEGINAQDLLTLAESMDLTDEQKREIFIENLKKSVQRQKPTTRLGSKVLKTSGTYKKERERKNKEQRASRKINR